MHTQTCKHDLFKEIRYEDHKCICPCQTKKPTPNNQTRPKQPTQGKHKMLKPQNPKVPKNKTAPQRQHHKPRDAKDKPPDLERRPTRLRENEAHHGETVTHHECPTRLAAAKGKQPEDFWAKPLDSPTPASWGGTRKKGGKGKPPEKGTLQPGDATARKIPRQGFWGKRG